MNSEQITAFLQEHWNWVTLVIGAVLLIGAIMNWNWLCAPTGKPDSHRYAPTIQEMLTQLQVDYGYNHTDALLVLKDIMARVWKGQL